MAADTIDPIEWSIFDATDACRRSFEDCLTIASLTDQEWAENRLADFNLWTAGVGASVKSRASLDERLAFEPEVRALVVNLLITLKAFVEQCRELGLKKDGRSQNSTSTIGHVEKHRGVAGVDATSPGNTLSRQLSQVSSASSSNSGSEAISDSEPPLTEAIKSTEVILDQLTRLAVAIRKSGTASRLLKADRSLDPKDHKDLRDHLALILLARPSDIEDRRHAYWDASRSDKPVSLGVDANQLNTVQLRLLDANIRRRNRFVYAQHHARKLGGSQAWSMPKRIESHDFDAIKRVSQQKETVSNQKQDNAELRKLKITQDTLAATDTTASAVGTAIVLNTPNAVTPSQQAMTQVSSTGLKVTYPNPPEVKVGLRSFKCPCCCETFPEVMTERHLWRKHIAADLRPYTCPFDACPEPETLYITREEWMNHFQTDHQRSKYWECFACDELGRILDVETFVMHIQNRHREAISENQIPTLIDICSQLALPTIASCPLCDVANEQGVLDQNSLLDHVAKHIHEFSLRSLPWAAAADEVDKSHFDRSLAKVKDWFTTWPTSEEGEEYRPVLDAEHETQDVNNYFRQNDYFAEDSQRSSVAQMHFHTSGDDSEENLSLSSLSEGDFEPTAAEVEPLLESASGELKSSASQNELLVTKNIPSNVESLAAENEFIMKGISNPASLQNDGRQNLGANYDARSSDRADLIVGIDFGMTYTGVAYARPKMFSPKLIQEWPDKPGELHNKVPTMLLYGRDNSLKSWGFSCQSDPKRKEWFKRYLDERLFEEDIVRHKKHFPGQYPPFLSIEEVRKCYQDYMSSLYYHVGEKIQKNESWTDKRVEFVFSLPATFKATEITNSLRPLLRNAGFGTGGRYHSVIFGLTEPQASAVFTAVDETTDFANEDIMLVCDAGGGTTDLAIMQMVGNSEHSPELKELLPVAGYNFGSTNIDESFCMLVEERLRGANLELKDSIAWTMMHSTEFQSWKRAFGSFDEKELKEIPVKVPGLKTKISNEKAGIVLGAMMFSHNDFRKLFDIEVDKMIDKTRNQMDIMNEKYPNKNIDYLVLSGGLGSSAYVQKRLKEVLTGANAHSAAPSLKVIVASNDEPQLAVVKGLVWDRFLHMRTGKAVVRERLARASYGVICNVVYDPRQDIGYTPYKDPLDGRLWLKDHIIWVIKKGQSIDVDNGQKHKFSRIFTREQPRKWKSTVVICHNDADDLPDNIYNGKEKNSDVTILAEIESDLSRISVSRFTERKGKRRFLGLRKGDTYYEARYDIKFIIGSALDLRFELWFQGQQWTATNAIAVTWHEGVNTLAQPSEAPQKKIYSTERGRRTYEWEDDDSG